MEQDRLGRSSRNFPGATEHLKRQSCFSGQNVPNGNSCSIYFKAIFDTSFTPSQSFFGKWNRFVQMVNASPGRNSPFLNFAHHLPKPWTNLFPQYVKAKQPESWSSTFRAEYIKAQIKWMFFRVSKGRDLLPCCCCWCESQRRFGDYLCPDSTRHAFTNTH